jgi:hypothetical protein
MPPEMMIMVAPKAAMPTTAVCNKMVCVFRQLANDSHSRAANRLHTITSPTSGPS